MPRPKPLRIISFLALPPLFLDLSRAMASPSGADDGASMPFWVVVPVAALGRTGMIASSGMSTGPGGGGGAVVVVVSSSFGFSSFFLLSLFGLAVVVVDGAGAAVPGGLVPAEEAGA